MGIPTEYLGNFLKHKFIHLDWRQAPLFSYFVIIAQAAHKNVRLLPIILELSYLV
jgi:hypothetical protein